MRILSITAQKPDSTGSGIYLTELVRAMAELGHEQAVVAGVMEEDVIRLPEGTEVFPVYFGTERLPFPVAGMSDEMPYESTRYCDMTDEMVAQFEEAFTEKLKAAVESFQPDCIICHHLYLLTALVRRLFPEMHIEAICHGSDLRQINKNGLCREKIKAEIRKLDGIWALHEEQKRRILETYGCCPEKVQIIGSGYNNRIFYQREQGRLKKEEADEKGILKLIFAGKIAEKKGVKSLIKALDHLDRPKDRLCLTLAGGWGNEKEYEEICELARNCRYQVRFCGRIPQEELAEEISGHHIFVLPSFYEGLPLVTIESIACGAEVICTDLPGIRPWMDAKLPGHGTVFVEPPVMKNEDEPEEASLEGFERRLAKAIETIEERQRTLSIEEKEGIKELRQRGLERISWQGIAGLILGNAPGEEC